MSLPPLPFLVRADLGTSDFGLLGPASVINGDVCAFTGETYGNCLPYAGRSSCDQHVLAFQFLAHCTSIFHAYMCSARRIIPGNNRAPKVIAEA